MLRNIKSLLGLGPAETKVKTFGAESVGKGLDRLFTMADQYYVYGTGATPLERPSTWLSVLGGILGPELTDKVLSGKVDSRYLEEMYAFPLTNVWDYLEEYYAYYTAPVAARDAAAAAARAKARAETPLIRNLEKYGSPGVSFNGTYVKT